MTFRLRLDMQDKFKMWFHEWEDKANDKCCLGLVREIRANDSAYYYDERDLFEGGYLTDSSTEFDVNELKGDGILPLQIDDSLCPGVSGKIYKLTFSDKHNKLADFENKWLPLPYFFKRTEKRYKFGPLNWSRFKLIPQQSSDCNKEYDVIVAFDTRAAYVDNGYNEYPVFPDKYGTEMKFDLCADEFLLMDFCSTGDKKDNNWNYIDKRLFKLVYPNYERVSQVKGQDVRKMSYIASYVFLIKYLAERLCFPQIKLFKDSEVEVRNIDMVIDIGNSKTTALLIEDNSNFNQVKPLHLVDYTDMIAEGTADKEPIIRSYSEPFDMRLAFRRVDFGAFGIEDSKQFVYPSFIRLGQEANALIHRAGNGYYDQENLSTYSSPKRYLWDTKPNKNEWMFLVLPGEDDIHILNIQGISNQLKSDGSIDVSGVDGGRTSKYSRRSLMTFAFLEMLVQANAQINSDQYRTDAGYMSQPRKIKRIVVTCPTAMSKVEREALVKCAKDATELLNNFKFGSVPSDIEIIPSVRSMKDEDGSWYYDEATCAQLVYMYGEAGYKYGGNCGEFFNLYGKVTEGGSLPSLTVGSLDIGAGTTDVMISEYTYTKTDDLTTITPDPKFYDSFYDAGDDMLKSLIENVMLNDENHSAFIKSFERQKVKDYKQKIKNFFGPDHNGQTISERIARKDFNIQYSVPLMHYFLNLASNDSCDCTVTYDDVFGGCQPNDYVIEDFKKRMGIDITELSWKYDKEYVAKIIRDKFDPLLKKIAAMFFAYSCDIVLLSGRPASLPAIRGIFLKYYPVSPNRLILLNNYYIGDWFPFCDNTGYITNPKAIVAMGGVIGHYASEYSNLKDFVINLDKLKRNLKSTVNFIEPSRCEHQSDYTISLEKSQGDITLSTIPNSLTVRQIGLESYPSRTLYSIDFNRLKIAAKVKKKAESAGEILSDAAIQARIEDIIDGFKKKMPFKVSISRDQDDKEKLSIVSIVDRYGNDVADSSIEIHIQSLGVDDQYWLDSGAFDF